ncbi:MAG: hypothetical protein WBB60_07070, partial [Nitrospira sp.]
VRWRAIIPPLSLLLCLPTLTAWGQAFNSGSTGSLGALAPATSTTVVLPADGILNYTTVTIPAGVTVTFQRNATNTPVTLLAQGAVTVAGAIRVNGDAALAGPTSGNVGVTPGQVGGPGGFRGGDGGIRGLSPSNGTGGLGTGGGDPGLFPAISTRDGSYGAAYFVNLQPIYGGSGGGGGVATTAQNGPSGAGGGGALVIASTTQILIQSTGVISANGGDGISGSQVTCGLSAGGAGSGGAIRLVAPQVTNQGVLQARGGYQACVGSLGYLGVVRVECVTCAIAATTPAAFIVNTLGPITSASTPAVTALPSVIVSSIGGVSVPSTPTGSHGSPDVALPENSSLDVPVTLTLQNVSVPRQFYVKMIPAMGEPQFFPATLSTGSFTSSTATAIVRMPPDVVCVLLAYLNYYPQVAGGFPLVDGEEVEHLLVAAGEGDLLTASLLTRSGRILALSDLSPEDQERIVIATGVMQPS